MQAPEELVPVTGKITNHLRFGRRLALWPADANFFTNFSQLSVAHGGWIGAFLHK